MNARGASAFVSAPFASGGPDAKSKAFAFGDFISFDKRQKKRKQRKTLPRTRQTRLFIDEGIFREGILPSRKTPHIHVRRPPGLLTAGRAVRSLEAKAKAGARMHSRVDSWPIRTAAPTPAPVSQVLRPSGRRPVRPRPVAAGRSPWSHS